MGFISGLLILVALFVFVAGVVGLFKPSIFDDPKKPEQPPATRKLALGVIAGSFVLSMIGGALSPDDKEGDKKAEQTQLAQTKTEPEKQSEQTQNNSNEPSKQATPDIANLDMDFDTFRRRVNEDFASADLPYKIPSGIKPTGEDARKTAMIQLDDSVGIIVATDPATDKITSISTIMSGSSDELKNIQRAGAVGFALASADGDDGNKTVGGDLINMMSKTMAQFGKKPNDIAKDKFVRNGVQYGINISKETGIMMYAEPVKQ